MAVGGKNRSGHYIEVKVDGEEHAEASLLKVRRQSDKFSKSIKAQTAQYIPAKKAAFDYQTALLAAGAALGAFTMASKKALALYAEQERAERALRVVAGDATDALIKRAGALQKTSIHGDEAIIATQKLLINIGGPKAREQINKATEATLELAAAFGWSLEQAARNVGKSYSGMTGELGEVITGISDLSVEARKNGAVIDMLISKFGGQSKAETDTLYGSMAQASNAANDLGEEFGETLAPAASFAAEQIKALSEAVIEFSKTFEGSNLRGLIREAGGGAQGLAMVIGAHAAQTLGLPGEDILGKLQGAEDLRRRTLEIFLEKYRKAQGKYTPQELDKMGADERAGWDVSSLLPKKGKGAGAGAFVDEIPGAAGSRYGSPMQDYLREKLEKTKAYEDQMQAIRLRNLDELQAAKFAAQSEEAEGRRLAYEQELRLHDLRMSNSAAMRDAIIDAAQSSMHAYSEFFGQLFNASRSTMHKVQKVMLFIEGGMAVTRGVVALQNALATLVQTQGASAADIPGAASLITSGTMMLAGQLLTSGRARSGGGGGGYSPRMSGGYAGGAFGGGSGGAVNNNYYFQTLEPPDPAAFGKRLLGYEDAARAEGA